MSALDQNTTRQLDRENLDRIFTDKASGKDQNHPQLDAGEAKEQLARAFDISRATVYQYMRAAS